MQSLLHDLIQFAQTHALCVNDGPPQMHRLNPSASTPQRGGWQPTLRPDAQNRQIKGGPDQTLQISTSKLGGNRAAALVLLGAAPSAQLPTP
ncbi:MAG: hypothetical protein CFE33_05030 [Pseudorhodobacter sp. PARRP1]|nr:MAG: hypothetical protein CFE33_05030 [Pseudorhodobacter sp. PARRP1]